MSGAAAPIRVVDSHTEGEPTRTVIEGGPDLGDGPLAGRLRRFRDRHDAYRHFWNGIHTLLSLCHHHRYRGYSSKRCYRHFSYRMLEGV